MKTIREAAKRLATRKSRVVCLGLGKTGTTSLAEAMKILGYNHKTMGFRHAFENRRMLPMYWSLLRYDSFDDFPWCYLYEYIERKFPNTRFILTTRLDEEKWYNSLVNHYLRGSNIHNHMTFYGYYSPLQNEAHFKRLYVGHNERVRQFFKGNPRFLELCWERGDGWNELCGFLGRRVPDVDFPHANRASSIDREEALERARIRLDATLT